MLTNFENIFRPTARRQLGFIDLKMLKRPTYAKDFVWNGMMAGLNWSMNATGNMDYETFLVRISPLKRHTNVLVEFLTTEGQYQQSQRNMRAVAENVGAKIL